MAKEPLQIALIMETGVSQEKAKAGNLVFQYKRARSPGKRIDALVKAGNYFVVEDRDNRTEKAQALTEQIESAA